MALKNAGLTRDQAWELFCAHNTEEFLHEHASTVENTMRYFAREFDPENEEFWGIVGMLHDLDWEEIKNADHMEHTIRATRYIKEAGGTDELCHAIQTHQNDYNPELPAPQETMEKVLFATEELTGLIGAAVAMRPSKSVMDLDVKSLRKKFKNKKFAAGCSRESMINGAALLGWELDELFERTITALQSFAPDKDSFVPAEEA